MKENGIIYDESWKRTLEEMEDEHIEEKLDEIETLTSIEKSQKNIKLRVLRERLKDIFSHDVKTP